MKNSKKKYFQYIAESFDCEAMGIPEDSTPRAKAKKFLSLIDGRHFQPTQKENCIHHLQGLGEYINIEFSNYDILQRAKKYGLVDEMLSNSQYKKYTNQELALERVEDRILERYWGVVADYVIQMSK